MGKRIFWSGITGAGGVFIKTAANILIIPFLMLYLGTERYGLYVLLISCMEMSLLLDFGFSAALIKELGSQLKSSSETMTGQSAEKVAAYSAGQWVYGILALLTLLLGYWISPHLAGLFHLPSGLASQANLYFSLTFIICAVYLYNSYFRAVLMSHCLHQWVNVGHFMNNVLGNLLGVAAILAGWDLLGFLIARLFSAVMMTLFLRHHATRLEPGLLALSGHVEPATMQRLLKFSGHTSIIQFSILLAHRIDAFVIGANLTLVAVSSFELLSRVISIISQLSTQVSQIFFPIYARLSAGNEHEKSKAFFLKASKGMNLITGLMLIMILINLPVIIEILSTGKILTQWPLAITLALICWSGSLQAPAGLYLLGSGRQRFVSTSSILAAVVNVILSLLLVKPLGIFGVALGTLIPQFIQHQAGLVWWSCRQLGLPLRSYIKRVHLRLLPTFLCAGVFTFALQSLLQPLAIDKLIITMTTSLVGGVLALLVCYLTGLEPDEKQILTQQAAGFINKRPKLKSRISLLLKTANLS